MPSPRALSRAPQGARNGIPAGEFGGGGGALTRRWPEQRTRTISPPPPPLNSQRGGNSLLCRVSEGREKEEQFYQICRNLRANNPFFQEWNKLLKKVCPSKLGTLKMDKPFQCLFIECILPSFLGNNFHSSCSLSLAIEAPPARDRWMGGSISSGEEEQQTLSLFPLLSFMECIHNCTCSALARKREREIPLETREREGGAC